MKGFDLKALQAANFVGAPKTHILRAYELINGFPPPEGCDTEEIRAELQQQNRDGDDVPSSAVEPATEAAIAAPARLDLRMPNLSPSGKWEGRMRRVTIMPPTEAESAFCCTIKWAEATWDVPYNTPVDMPWPFFEALRNAVHVDDCSEKARKHRLSEDGRAYVQITPIRRQVYQFLDHGDVPGTEHLPNGYREHFQRMAKVTQVFRDYTKPMLLLVHQKLFDGPPVDPRNQWRPLDLDPLSLRVRIAEALGTEFVNELNNELYAVA